jgi:hypothetical protein
MPTMAWWELDIQELAKNIQDQRRDPQMQTTQPTMVQILAVLLYHQKEMVSSKLLQLDMVNNGTMENIRVHKNKETLIK